MNRERGKFLTVMLVLTVLGLFQALYLVTNTDLLAQTLVEVPSWYTMYLLAGVALQAVGVVGIWMWKRWGAYLVFGWGVFGMLMQILVLKPVQGGQLALVMSFASIGLVFWAVYRKWNYFK